MPRSPEYELVIKYLGFEWVSRDTIYNDLTRKISPGKAIRAYEDSFLRNTRNRTGSGILKGKLPEPDQIVSGAHHLIRRTLITAEKSKNIQKREVGDTTYYRLNEFTSEDVDAIVAQKVNEILETASVVVDTQPTPTSFQPVNLFEMLFDIRSVQQIAVKTEGKLVSVEIPNFLADQPLRLSFNPEAADWFSDQLGIQALIVRKGKENLRKALPVSTDHQRR